MSADQPSGQPPARPSAQAGIDPARERRQRVGLLAIVLGIVAIVAATLMLASAGYGGRPNTQFSQRRSYNMVKREVHKLMPLTILQAMAGVGLVIWGNRQRSRED